MLEVQKFLLENSFINYFKSNTEIYKGMKVIDENLGGTTPLDVIIKFKEDKNIVKIEENSDFDDFENEFNRKNDDRTILRFLRLKWS